MYNCVSETENIGAYTKSYGYEMVKESVALLTTYIDCLKSNLRFLAVTMKHNFPTVCKYVLEYYIFSILIQYLLPYSWH